jgi:hypothetical protein
MKEKFTMKSWKYAVALAILPMSLWAANITGTVTSGTAPNTTNIVGAKVYLHLNTSTGALQDSAVTNAGGTYTITNPGANGQKVLTVNQSGYNPYVQAFGYNGTALTENITLVVNPNTSTIKGKVTAASSGLPIDTATVTLSGGGLGAPISVRTDSNGNYEFDSIPEDPGYSVSASAPKYLSQSVGNILANFDAVTTVSTLALVRNVGKVSGTIKTSATGNAVIKTGASVVFYSNGIKVDSVVTDTFGNYADSLNAITYNTVKISAAGYKSDSDLVALDTSVTVVVGANTTLNAFLTPATASLGGTISVRSLGTNPTTTTFTSGAKLILQRRTTNFGAGSTSFISVDSTTSDINGTYDFVNMIAGAQANYRVMIIALFTATNQTVDTVTGNTTVATGAFVTVNFTIQTPPTSILSFTPTAGNRVRFISMGDHVDLDLGQSSEIARTVSIFNLSGALQHQVGVPAGVSRVSVPGAYAPSNGFLFQIK